MIQMPLALAPPYMVVSSLAVAVLFAFFAIVPVILVAIFRNRIGRIGGIMSLTACVLVLSLAAIRLWELMGRNALAYWTTHCAALFLFSAIGSLVLLRRQHHESE
jgi:hypothetical protein